MAVYPDASDADHDFFAEHGWLRVVDAVDPEHLTHLERRCDEILQNLDTMAFDWAWEKSTPREQRRFGIVQAGPTKHFPELSDEPFRAWATRFASQLMARPMDFWYDQFLAKPPITGAVTFWHQDEAYWGRNLAHRGITCWMPFHDVDESNGCMHFIDGGHRGDVLAHTQPQHIASDLLRCEPDLTRAVTCPLRRGSVTFHHSRTPHMTTGNRTNGWRKILTQHFKAEGVVGEGGHYPWRVHVNQYTGERSVPADIQPLDPVDPTESR